MRAGGGEEKMEMITIKVVRNEKTVFQERYSDVTAKTLMERLERDYCRKVKETAEPSFRPNWYIQKIVLSDGKEIIPPEPFQLLQEIKQVIAPAVALQEFPYPFSIDLQFDLQQLIKEFQEDTRVKQKVQELALEIRNKIMDLWQDTVIPDGATVIVREVWD